MTSEEEQIKQLKKWWDDNGVSTLVSIALEISVVLGWQGWQRNQQANQDAAAFAYQELANVIDQVRQSPDDIKIAQATFLADDLKEKYADTGYGYFAALLNAKQAVADKDFDRAEDELKWVLSQKPTEEIQLLAQLRLARVLLAAERYDEGLIDLPQVSDSVFAPLFAEVRGDIFLAQEQHQQAYDAYKQAEDLAASLNVQAPGLLALKLQFAHGFL